MLSTALNKINAVDPQALPPLTEGEARALSNYLVHTTSASILSEEEQALCKQIRLVLEARVAQSHEITTADPAQRSEDGAQPGAFQRTNNALRATIDLFLMRDFALIKESDVKLLRETEARLQKMAREGEMSPNQTRLAQLVTKCLSNYSAWVTDQPQMPPPPVPDVTSAVTTANVHSVRALPDKGASTTWGREELINGAGSRELLSELADIPISLNARVASHAGNLILEGDCPEDIVLHVLDGHVTIHGAVAGHVVADGDIDVQGNVQGGWLYSKRGDIRSRRVLSMSTLIAPRGALDVEAVENAALVYCSGDCTIAGDAIGIIAHADNLKVGGMLRKATINVRGRLGAHSVELTPRDGMTVHFRVAQSCANYGRPISDAAISGIRQFARNHFRAQMLAALVVYLETERLNMCRALLYALRTKDNAAPVLRAFRGGHAVYAGLELLLEVSESIKEAFAFGECLGKDYTGGLVGIGLEEAATIVNLITKETALMAKEFVTNVEAVSTPCRHITNLAKKLKDAMRTEAGVDKQLYDFDFRLDEWREEAERGRAEYSGALAPVVKAIGESVFELTDCQNLDALIARLETQAGQKGLQGPEMRTLKQKSVQYGTWEAQWRETAEKALADRTANFSTVNGDVDLVLARRDDRGLRIEKMVPSVLIRTLDVQKKVSGRDGTSAVLSSASSPYQLRCEHLRLYNESGTPAH